MPIVNNPFEIRLSDILFHENSPCIGAAREDINVEVQAEPIKAGTVVFRALSETDQEAEYTVLTPANFVASVVVGNEFGIVIGDQFSFRSEFIPKEVLAGTFNAVVLKRDNIQVKDLAVLDTLKDEDGVLDTITMTEFNVLRELMKRQGVILELTF